MRHLAEATGQSGRFPVHQIIIQLGNRDEDNVHYAVRDT